MIAFPSTAVPVPDRIAQMIGAQMPIHVLQAEIDAEVEKAEALRFRPLVSAEDHADREDALARLAWRNRILAAYNPGLIVKAGGQR
ncbi:hypothetical protein [Streptomyces sp. NPDC003032]